MKKFTFSLEALLQQRLRDEDLVKRELADINSVINIQQQELISLESQLKELQKSQVESRKSGTTNNTVLRYSISYRNKLKLDMMKKGHQIQESVAKASHIQNRLIEAVQKRKAVEILKEKKQEEWLAEVKKNEQKFLDDLAQQGYIRGRRNRT